MPINPYNLRPETLKGSLPVVTGDVVFVSSVTGNSSGDGSSLRPFSSIENALGKSGLSAGDTIAVLPSHTETVAAAGGLTLDVAGIEIIGYGVGSIRPKINFTTAVGASMVVSAANCSMKNFVFTGGIDALTNPVHIQAANFSLVDCVTRDVTGQATDFIVTTAAADYLTIKNWRHEGAAAAGADTAISIVGGAHITIEDFWIDGNFAVAAIENVTTAATNLTIVGNKQSYIRTRNAADVAITLVATSTGNVGPNINIRLLDNAANITECLVGADMQFFAPLKVCNADGELALEWNGTASVDEA